MLKDWVRPYYQANGGEPFLFFAVYGAIDTSSPISGSAYRTNGVPDGLEMMHYSLTEHPEVVAGFREGYLWERLKEENAPLAGRIAAATGCLIVRGTPANFTDLNFLRDTVGLLAYLLDHGGLCVYDPQMFYWWTPEEWRERIFSADMPVPQRHVVILTSPDDKDNLTWFHTRGMRKFGRPDLSIHNVSEQQRPAIIELCNRLIEMQALGAIVPEGQKIQMASLPEGMTCHHAGDLEDPDFNNVHIEIYWPS